MMPRLLFVLKNREDPWGAYGTTLSSGLRNSVKFIVEMLNLLGIDAKMVQVIDNNFIDREVTLYRPTHCIIEAFWVVPEKFDILKKLHPLVTWIVRNHSEMPFLANEGIAMGWIAGYLARGVEVSCNAARAKGDFAVLGKAFGSPALVSYMPNYYPVHVAPAFHNGHPPMSRSDDLLKIGCFGAIRPLKNHLMQAVAALRCAAILGKKLEFNINSTRLEGGGNPILKNLRQLFEKAPRATLVEIPWLDHSDFLTVVRDMDINLQVSFSETFNIVSADAVNCNVPVVVSAEVPWLGTYAQADPNDSESICNQMLMIFRQFDKRARLIWQWRDLTKYCENTQHIWWERFGYGDIPAKLLS